MTAGDCEGGRDDEGRARSEATRLVNLAREHATLFHAPDGEPFATVGAAGHLEVLAVRSRQFRTWLSRLSFSTTRRVASSRVTEEAIRTLEGFAAEGDTHEVFLRIGHLDGTFIYLDLANEMREVVEIGLDGWRILSSQECPVHFQHARGMLPLPKPVRGGSLKPLRLLLNLDGEEAFVLVKGWLLGALHPRGPYPVIVFTGEQGAGKTVNARRLRWILDPNRAGVRAQPRDERDLVIAAHNGWIVALDNVSNLPPWLSDALCRLASGSGFGTRQLYTDADEMLFEGARPVILNGIEDFVTRGDLLERSISLILPSIPEERRRTEAEIEEKFRSLHPALLGALLDAACEALRNERHVHLDRLPRMADFARWVVAGEKGLGLPSGRFSEVYAHNRTAGNAGVLEGSAIAPEILKLSEKGNWSGTATQLLRVLEGTADDSTKRRRSWPRSPRTLSDALRRLAPNLRTSGVEIDFVQTPGRRSQKLILLEKGPGACDASDASDARGSPASMGTRSASQTAPNASQEGRSNGSGVACVASVVDLQTVLFPEGLPREAEGNA